MGEAEISSTRGKSLAHAEEVEDEGQLQVHRTRQQESTETLGIWCLLRLWLIPPWIGWTFDWTGNGAARPSVSSVGVSPGAHDSHEEIRCVIGGSGRKRVCDVVQDVLWSEPGSNVRLDSCSPDAKEDNDVDLSHKDRRGQ